MSRSLARELAFKALFQLEFNSDEGEFKDFYEEVAIDTVISSGKKLKQSECLYVKKVVKETRARLEEIDEIISAHLKKSWSIQRLATVDRNVLRLSIYEIKFAEKVIPKGIIINEAVEIAKKYGTDDSGRFVNGLLAAIAN